MLPLFFFFLIKSPLPTIQYGKKQVEATLTRLLGIVGYVDGTIASSTEFLDAAKTNSNPCYSIWFHQDQIILGALLRSCSDTIQLVLSSADTFENTWKKLIGTFSSKSSGRVISLKAKLTNNPRSAKLIAGYLQEIQC